MVPYPSNHRHARVALLWFSLALLCGNLQAAVLRFEITERGAFAGGQSFGPVGEYERIVGEVHFSIDPKRPQNRTLVDLDLVPPNASGQVEFSADLYILAPKHLKRGNGSILYDVNNRGRKLALRFFNHAPLGNDPQDAGDGFLMRQGFTLVWSGWNSEVLEGDGRMRLRAPVATGEKGPITGPVRYEICTHEEGKTRLSVTRTTNAAYRPTPDGLRKATLSWRNRPGDPRVPIPRQQFGLRISDVDPVDAHPMPLVELELPAGFRPGYLYELIYEAQDPVVHGLGFASVRDLISALRNGLGRGNPVVSGGKPILGLAYGFGVSQSGRFLREFLYSGFNQDERGERVFDGIMPHVAGAGLGSFNHRFAQPTAYVTQHRLHDWPTDRFPFAYQIQRDPLSGYSDGILRRATVVGVVPRVIHTQSSTEYWSRSGSLVHTDPLGSGDAVLPETVRVFAFGGTQHGISSYPPEPGIGQALANPADYRPLLKALLVALDRWCRQGEPAPPSIYPTIQAGTLVEWIQETTGFPWLPGVRYPQVIQQPARLDFGPRWPSEGIIDRQPPGIAGHYRVRVPRCGQDGNELDCLLPPEVAVPLATFTGWNLRSREAGAESELVGLNGSYLRLALSEADRRASGDPRLSLEERYGSVEEYRKQLVQYCSRQVQLGYLLAEDVDRIVQRQVQRARERFQDPGDTRP